MASGRPGGRQTQRSAVGCVRARADGPGAGRRSLPRRGGRWAAVRAGGAASAARPAAWVSSELNRGEGCLIPGVYSAGVGGRDERTSEWMDGWTDGGTDGRTNE